MFNPFKKKKEQDASPINEEPLSPEADQFLAAACSEYDAKQAALLEGEWRLTSSANWDFDMESGIVVVNFDDGSQWQANGQFLGSYHPETQTFQWAWDSPDVSEPLARDSQLIRTLGEQFGLQYLLMGGGSFPLPGTEFLDYLCAIGLKATGSDGIMEAQAEDLIGLLLLKNLRWTKTTE